MLSCSITKASGVLAIVYWEYISNFILEKYKICILGVYFKFWTECKKIPLFPVLMMYNISITLMYPVPNDVLGVEGELSPQEMISSKITQE